MLNISDAVRSKMYDRNNPQRMLFVADDGYGNYVTISNEDIDVNGGITFTLESMNTEPLMFGCTPQSNVQLQLHNDMIDGARRYRTADLGERKFTCFVGVQTNNNLTQYASLHNSTIMNMQHDGTKVMACCRSDDLSVYVLENGHVVMNKKVGSMSAFEYTLIDEAKIAIVMDTVYLVYRIQEAYLFYKIRKINSFTYGDLEQADLVAITFLKSLLGCTYQTISYGKKHMEIGYALEEDVPGFSTWGEFLGTTWGNITEDWSEYSGSQKYKSETYYNFQYGVWNTEMPRRTSTDVINLSAVDNMGVFDVDNEGFIKYLRAIKPKGKITCKQLVQYLCSYLDVPIGSLANFSDMGGGSTKDKANIIDANVYQQFKSCKDLLSYALEVGAVNGIFDRYGKFRTTHSMLSSETSDVEPLPYVYTTDVADYNTLPINTVLVYKQEDVIVYMPKPGTAGDNPYEWSDNPFFNKISMYWWSGSDNVEIYGNYRDAVVTACANYALWCDDRYSFVVDGETCVEPIFTMSVLWNSHGTVTYSNSGCRYRESQTYAQRESGILNSNIKTLNGDRYRVSIGDQTDSATPILEMSDSLILFGNQLSDGDQNVKTLRISNYEMILANRSGYLYNTESGFQFSHRSGKYKFDKLSTSASAANLCVDADTGYIYRVTSLARNKEHVETIVNPWEKVDNLRGVSYTSNCDMDDPNKVMYGFIAEEVEKSVPELAEYSNDTLSSVQYDRFTALLIEDCKESHKRIRELEKRLEELEGRLK